MKKKIIFFIMLAISLVSLCACGFNKIDLKNYLIEERINLFTASDDLYSVSLSTGYREENYEFDGIVNDKVPFGVITFVRNNNSPLANDNYSYIITINENTYNGFLEKSQNDNSYCTDLETEIKSTDKINVQISFTGYTFNQDLNNTSSEFAVDGTTALSIANKELKDNLKDVTSDKNVKIEVVMKLMKDYSSAELKNYYWYVGVISTSGDTLGILIDANSAEIIAKKI